LTHLWGSSDRSSVTWILHGLRREARHRSSIRSVVVLLTITALVQSSLLADGCFVFRWDKKIDINEPTQKAIILHDSGREDLLLQVKYEGPLEEFGWLIPVASVPKVEQGSMEAFYELSQLTQRNFGNYYKAASLGSRGSHEEPVKVVEIKTVGAYEVAVLSAQDSGSLARWLKANEYSIPEGKSEIIDEYIGRGWYFIAAKIQLNKGVSFKAVSGAGSTVSAASTRASKAIQSQLSSGELHPLLISFDTPRCVFPLKISAVGNKPSEVSLYVLSAEPLLDRFIFDHALEQMDKHLMEWRQERERMRPQREKQLETCLQNLRSLQLAYQMYSLAPRSANTGRPTRDWTLEDLVSMGKEGQPTSPREPLDDDFPAASPGLFQCMQVAPEKIPKCAKLLPRLKGKGWYLTKQVWSFRPEAMHDLEFEPAVPVVAQILPLPGGAVAARLLSQLGPSAGPFLIAACKSSNATERINASAVLGWPKDARCVEPLLNLLKDELPQVRLHALNGVGLNWDARFIGPLIALFRDEHPEIRIQAAQCLRLNDSGQQPEVYLKLLNDADPDVQLCALQVLSRTNGAAIPRATLLRLLGSSRIQTVFLALSLLDPGQASLWRGQAEAQNPFTKVRAENSRLSSAEAAPLSKNPLTLARLAGLKILQQNADTDALELTLPLLRDTNSIVRNRALVVLRTVSGQDILDPAEWEQWWAANRDSFSSHKPAQ
jgi:HEAT repeat protein